MREFYRLTDVDNSNPWLIPKRDYREVFAPAYRTAVMPVVGVDGAFDLHGDRRSPLDAAAADIGFRLVASCPADLQGMVDAMWGGLEGLTRDAGRRKLWRYERGDKTAPRWTWARLAARPPIERALVNERHLDVELSLLVPEPFFYEALTTKWLTDNGYTAVTLSSAVTDEPIAPDYVHARFAVAATPYDFTLTNRGDVESRRVTFRFDSSAVNGFTNPRINNLTTGQQFDSSRDGSTASHILSVNCAPGLGRARLSTDGGTTWADDTPLLTLPSTQAVVCELAPGANAMRYTDGGTPNLNLDVWWLHAWRE